MQAHPIFTILLLAILMITCKNKRAIQSSLPSIEAKDNAYYANVFAPLDGHWRGQFYVLQSKNGQTSESALPTTITPTYLQKLELDTTMIIKVHQYYQSHSPYLQEVEITDTYTDADGQQSVIKSTGINKVENGRLWCIVDKPNEQIRHEGCWEKPTTIIWQGVHQHPFKIEYFRETVSDSAYTIVGWGYYGNDDPTKSPKTWFWGDYRKAIQ